MEGMELRKPTEEFAAEIMAYRGELEKCGEVLGGMPKLEEARNAQEWIEQCRKAETGEELPEGSVSNTWLLYVREADSRVVGILNLRHTLTPGLENFGGHIGYCVRPSERGKGYGNMILSDCLKYCKEKRMDKVLLTCRDNNEKSKRIILKNGGVYEDMRRDENHGKNMERYWITLS